jgi:chromosome segregation ATPase
MSDVSLATPQAEDQEMGKVREIFDRALNALVDATSLAKDVETLKNDLDTLKGQVTHYRNTIANQDDQITRLRQDRDAARTAQYQAEDDQRHKANELVVVKRENDAMNTANVRLNDRISEITKERDDAQFKLLELQEAHTTLSKKMDAIKGHFEAMFGFQEPARPEPAPTPEPVVPEPEPTPTSRWEGEPAVKEHTLEELKPIEEQSHEAWWTKDAKLA